MIATTPGTVIPAGQKRQTQVEVSHGDLGATGTSTSSGSLSLTLVTVEPAQSRQIFEYVGDTIRVDTGAMVVDHPYSVTYRGAPAIAIRHADGRVAFYRLPKS